MAQVFLREEIPPASVQVGGKFGGTTLRGRPFWIYGRGGGWPAPRLLVCGERRGMPLHPKGGRGAASGFSRTGIARGFVPGATRGGVRQTQVG